MRKLPRDRHHPVLCIVPPHLLDRLARSSDPRLRALAEAALESLLATERLRGQREALGPLGFAATPAGARRRTIYDARHLDRLPGTIVRGEDGAPVTDVAVNEAFDGLGATWDFYFEVLDRNSIDGRGLRLDATVHYRDRFDNAFWNGRQMVFGDGDGIVFRRFTASLDVIGHELTHGVTQYEAGLTYEGQPGALNEHLSDVFGSLVKQYRLGQSAAEADWLIGAGLFTPAVRGVALRSMKAPGTAYDDPRLGKDPQPAHMRDYVETRDDYGGVHINSGIPNHAFYRVAIALGGHAWEVAGAIWYGALTELAGPATDFTGMATATLRIAARDHGRTAAQAVRAAWRAVGIEPRPHGVTRRREGTRAHPRGAERRTSRVAHRARG